MNVDKLELIFTSATPDDIQAFITVFNLHESEYGLTTPFQQNAFLAQVLAEVGSELKSVRENLNYSCDSLMKTFGYYRRNPDLARKHGRCGGHKANQVDIGNHAYADRIGNSGINSGDGYRFRGGGFFQLTGRANYEQIGQSLPIQHTAEELEEDITTVEYGLVSAMAFWFLNGCHECTHID